MTFIFQNLTFCLAFIFYFMPEMCFHSLENKNKHPRIEVGDMDLDFYCDILWCCYCDNDINYVKKMITTWHHKHKYCS